MIVEPTAVALRAAPCGLAGLLVRVLIARVPEPVEPRGPNEPGRPAYGAAAARPGRTV